MMDAVFAGAGVVEMGVSGRDDFAENEVGSVAGVGVGGGGGEAVRGVVGVAGALPG